MGNTDVWGAQETRVWPGDDTAEERGWTPVILLVRSHFDAAAVRTVSLNVSPADRHSPGVPLPFVLVARGPFLPSAWSQERHTPRADPGLAWPRLDRGSHPSTVLLGRARPRRPPRTRGTRARLAPRSAGVLSLGRKGGNLVDICLPVGP